MFSSPGSVLAMPIWRSRGRHQLDDAEFRDVAADLVEPLGGPGRNQAREPPPGNAVLVFQKIGHALGIEQAERRFEDGADLAADHQRIDRPLLHQLLQPLRQRRLAATDRAEQIKDLLAFLEALSRIAEITDDPLDRIFHAIEVGKGRIDLDGSVGENSAETLVWARFDEGRVRRWLSTIRSCAVAYMLLSSRHARRYSWRLDLFLRCTGVNLRKEIEDVGFTLLHHALPRPVGCHGIAGLSARL